MIQKEYKDITQHQDRLNSKCLCSWRLQVQNRMLLMTKKLILHDMSPLRF